MLGCNKVKPVTIYKVKGPQVILWVITTGLDEYRSMKNKPFVLKRFY